MAAAFVQKKGAEIAIGFSTITITPTSATTTVNANVIIIRTEGNAITSVADGTNTYTSAGATPGSPNPTMFSYYAKNITGTSANIVVTVVGTPNFAWGYFIEFSGIDTTAPLDVTNDKTGTGVTDIVSDAITTAQTGAVVGGVSQPAFTTYTAGANYTLADGAIGTGPYGGVEYRITSSALSSEVQHITSGSTAGYSFTVIALKDSGGGAAALSNPSTLTLMGVQ